MSILISQFVQLVQIIPEISTYRQIGRMTILQGLPTCILILNSSIIIFLHHKFELIQL